MFAIQSVLVLYFMTILLSDCQRRIKGGEKLTIDRRYVVYLTKAYLSKLEYDHWICGGAIVSSQFVLTSAACVSDVDFVYVIAGYRKYVPDEDIELDKCTSKMKKKVIYTCFPANYTLEHEHLQTWSNIDIALVRVESPYDFSDASYETLCHYRPTSVAINYDEKYQQPGADALVFGWGHTTHWRMPEDPENYNQEFLNYAPTLLLNKTICIERYKNYVNMSAVIESYMICSLGKGNTDEKGRPIQQSLPIQDGCTSEQHKLMGFEGISCEKSVENNNYGDDETRRYNKGSNKSNNATLNNKGSNKTNNATLNNKESNRTTNATLNDFNRTVTRKSGICQNDHGGPLITWAGTREILIGIASVFKVTDHYECMGPYLYTSTQRTGNFLDCILNSQFPDGRRRAKQPCDLTARERGYKTVERIISWKNHPAGPADNEK